MFAHILDNLEVMEIVGLTTCEECRECPEHSFCFGVKRGTSKCVDRLAVYFTIKEGES